MNDGPAETVGPFFSPAHTGSAGWAIISGGKSRRFREIISFGNHLPSGTLKGGGAHRATFVLPIGSERSRIDGNPDL
jgi:hypothetical protein